MESGLKSASLGDVASVTDGDTCAEVEDTLMDAGAAAGIAASLDPSTSAGDESVSAGTRKRTAVAAELPDGQRPATQGEMVHVPDAAGTHALRVRQPCHICLVAARLVLSSAAVLTRCWQFRT